MKPKTKISVTYIYVGTIQIKYKLLQGRGIIKDVTQEVTQRTGPGILFFHSREGSARGNTFRGCSLASQ